MKALLESLGFDPFTAVFVLAMAEFVFILLLLRTLARVRGTETAPKSDSGDYRPGSLLEAQRAPQPKRFMSHEEDSGAGVEEAAGDKKEYNYVDPDFELAPLEPGTPIMGREEAEHGDAVYGTEHGYDRGTYLGRVSRGAELELLDRRVYKNEFELNIIKVRILKNQSDTASGQIGWIGLDETNFRSRFDTVKREIV